MQAKRLFSLMLAAAMLVCAFPLAIFALDPANQFTDVPEESYAYQDILQLRELGITDGIGDNLYGIKQNLSRADFVILLARLLQWDTTPSQNPDFTDVPADHYAYPYLSAAVREGMLAAGGAFRPGDHITREEMAVMLVSALGYQSMANGETIGAMSLPFLDVTPLTHPKTYGYMVMAYDFGLINGMTPTTFSPNDSATREQTAAMVMRLYRKYTSPISELHSFYQDPVGYNQKDYFVGSDVVSVGWARLEYWNSKGGAYLNLTKDNQNRWYVPDVASELMTLAQQAGTPVNLSVQMLSSQRVTLPSQVEGQPGEEKRDVDLILLDPLQRTQAVTEIVNALGTAYGSGSFSGVTIDFEGTAFVEDTYRQALVDFLTELRGAMDAVNPDLLLYIAVAPNGYKSYDYRAIGDVCDKVILMAHDYQVTSLPDYMRGTDEPQTPLTPIDKIYRALKSITNGETGVQDLSKIELALSFATIRWEIQDGKVTHEKSKLSTVSNVYQRLCQETTEMFYSDKYQNPYIRYYDDSDQTTNVVWYEDARSVSAKQDLARMFGVTGVSLWQLGVIPDLDSPAGRDIYYNVWQELLSRIS